MCFGAYADSKGPDQPVHPYSLIRTFANNHWAGLGGSVGLTMIRRLQAQPQQGRQHSFEEIDREIFSKVILSLLLIQEGQLSVSKGKNVHNTG